MTKEKETWHALTFHIKKSTWTLSENRYDRGRHLKTFRTPCFKSHIQVAPNIVRRVRDLLGSSLTELRIYRSDCVLVQTIHFSGADNESTL